MSDIRPGANTQAQFFNPKNEAMLDRLLYADFQRRVGGDLTEKQQERLKKTVKHYMTEAYAKNSEQPIQYLNKEVLTSVVPDYMAYLRRNSEQGPAASGLGMQGPAASGLGMQGPAASGLGMQGPAASGLGMQGPAEDNLRLDVNSRFGQLQNERQEMRPAMPAAPDFQISMDSDGPTPLSRFEEIKRIRDAEAAREAETAAAMAAARAGQPVQSQELVVVPSDTSMNRFVNSDVDFKNGAQAANERDRLAVIMREAERAAGIAQRASQTEIVSYPDPRRVLLGDSMNLPVPPRTQGIATASPTTALPDRVAPRGVLPQDVLKSQDDIIAYKELEHNLYVYSADRDWVNNTTETRYNFSVNFDPANNQSGFGYNTATNVKFKNIVRIEFVKAIMSTESFDVLATASSGASGLPAIGTPISTLNTNILSFPYLQVRIPELNVNGFGTNDGINNAFASISYDAYWTSDSNANNKGYARMIPKFLKCQKVYYPTPLSTLQKLSFQIQRPDGTLVSTTSDTLDVSGVFMPSSTASGASYYKATGTTSWEWLWISTKNYFNKFMVTQGDRIVLKNIALNSTLTALGANATNMVSFLTRAEGHLVCDVGRVTNTGTVSFDAANTAGYANGIIIRNNFADPTTGATTVASWVTSIAASVNSNPTTTAGRLINMNHQTQIIMRVITREMDAAAKLRPDNLQA